MAQQPSKHGRCTRQLVFFLPTLLLLSSSTSTAALAAVVPTSYSSHCAFPSPAPDRHADVSNDAELLSSFHLQPSTGFFSGRDADGLFSPDDAHGRSLSFQFLPRGVSRTADPTLLHLTARLTLSGCRAKTFEYDDGRPENYRRNNHSTSSTAISFNLDGYYSSTSSELCMVGTGTDEAAADVLMTVHFASFGEAQGFGHGKGRISSLRDSTDDLYFETRDITFFGMGKGNHQQQLSASIWRMDPEHIVTVASTTRFCVVFTVLWRLRASRRNHEPAMSMAMHVVIISLWCIAMDFILSHWVFFLVTFVHMFS